MQKLKISRQSLNEAAKILKKDGIIIFPTETVYGIGALASSESAVKRIFEVKKRPYGKPLQILISDISQVNQFASEISNKAKEVMRKYWPGPLTLIFKKKPKVSDIITSSGNTVGLRMPKNSTILKLIKEVGPIVASSANISGQPDPTSPEEVKIEADLLLDGGRCKMGRASTVVDVSVDPPLVLREGKIHLSSRYIY
jgi:L-threonylcarbamoyladenylate synthase